MSKKAMNRIMAAGWMAGMCPVSRKYFAFISPAIGSQPSAPAGRDTLKPVAPCSRERTQRRNWIPNQPFRATNDHWTMRLIRCELSGTKRRISFFFSSCEVSIGVLVACSVAISLLSF